jgi:uncharacterized protein YuzE
MAEKMIFKYDREADILYINKRAPYAEQESEELGDDVIARFNPDTGDVENVEVLFVQPDCCVPTSLRFPSP